MSSFGVPSPDAAVYVISVAAELTGLHPQTLRTYERLGLITPVRTGGGGRRYSIRDIERLRQIADLTGAGIGLEGVRRILDLDARATALAEVNRELLEELQATREALRQAQAALTGEQPTGQRAGGQPKGGSSNRLPALRQNGTQSSLVVWRRQR
ncbi:heat shock protein transcriptional repressor HspR [Nocardioides jishulii]|uniref:MerR family transcriptional regulator n=1 Tax=Nocardioides jishulii TaxID=2575440 RepID=A0A4U2YRV4_9ACTN|nr:helix-turn-helix transcriptional regulator [Nocardioides jishulii]QCX26355.1 MerR family transcriptional regulator [Nocardioides jishulii]TKI63840.1 MerR family transcriptional regulator [Nocardioides jishulii]